MIKYIEDGNIFESSAQCLINPVNCVGVMGAGLALEFKRRFPHMFFVYKTMCKEGSLRVGQVSFWAGKDECTKVICLFPTKYHFREASTISIIEQSLQAFIKFAPMMKVHSVAFPKVGCGLGGLNFTHQVKPLLEKYLSATALDVEVYI